RPPLPTLLPYTTLFRSSFHRAGAAPPAGPAREHARGLPAPTARASRPPAGVRARRLSPAATQPDVRRLLHRLPDSLPHAPSPFAAGLAFPVERAARDP